MSSSTTFTGGSRAPLPSGNRTSLFKSILDSLPFLRRTRSRTEGVLITHNHTPASSPPGTPRTPYASQFQSRRSTSFDVSPAPASPALRPPPRRSNTGFDGGSPRSDSPRVVEEEGRVTPLAQRTRPRSLLDEGSVRRRVQAE